MGMEGLDSGGDPGWAIAQNIEGFVQGAHNRYSSDRSYNFARQQWHDQREMADNRYRAAVKDMRLAGLNPAMMYSQHGGASPMASGVGSGGGSGSGAGFNAVAASQVDVMKAEARNINAEADRNEQIAAIMKSIAPRIVQGVGAVESGARAGGEAVGRVTEAVEAAMRHLGSLKLPGVSDFRSLIDGIVSDLLNRPQPFKMPEAIKDVEGVLESYDRPRSAWGMSEYERAQEERKVRARQSPASRRRGGR